MLQGNCTQGSNRERKEAEASTKADVKKAEAAPPEPSADPVPEDDAIEAKLQLMHDAKHLAMNPYAKRSVYCALFSCEEDSDTSFHKMSETCMMRVHARAHPASYQLLSLNQLAQAMFAVVLQL